MTGDDVNPFGIGRAAQNGVNIRQHRRLGHAAILSRLLREDLFFDRETIAAIGRNFLKLAENPVARRPPSARRVFLLRESCWPNETSLRMSASMRLAETSLSIF